MSLLPIKLFPMCICSLCESFIIDLYRIVLPLLISMESIEASATNPNDMSRLASLTNASAIVPSHRHSDYNPALAHQSQGMVHQYGTVIQELRARNSHLEDVESKYKSLLDNSAAVDKKKTESRERKVKLAHNKKVKEARELEAKSSRRIQELQGHLLAGRSGKARQAVVGEIISLGGTLPDKYMPREGQPSSKKKKTTVSSTTQTRVAPQKRAATDHTDGNAATRAGDIEFETTRDIYEDGLMREQPPNDVAVCVGSGVAGADASSNVNSTLFSDLDLGTLPPDVRHVSLDTITTNVPPNLMGSGSKSARLGAQGNVVVGYAQGGVYAPAGPRSPYNGTVAWPDAVNSKMVTPLAGIVPWKVTFDVQTRTTLTNPPPRPPPTFAYAAQNAASNIYIKFFDVSYSPIEVVTTGVPTVSGMTRFPVCVKCDIAQTSTMFDYVLPNIGGRPLGNDFTMPRGSVEGCRLSCSTQLATTEDQTNTAYPAYQPAMFDQYNYPGWQAEARRAVVSLNAWQLNYTFKDTLYSVRAAAVAAGLPDWYHPLGSITDLNRELVQSVSLVLFSPTKTDIATLEAFKAVKYGFVINTVMLQSPFWLGANPQPAQLVFANSVGVPVVVRDPGYSIHMMIEMYQCTNEDYVKIFGGIGTYPGPYTKPLPETVLRGHAQNLPVRAEEELHYVVIERDNSHARVHLNDETNNFVQHVDVSNHGCRHVSHAAMLKPSTGGGGGIEDSDAPPQQTYATAVVKRSVAKRTRESIDGSCSSLSSSEEDIVEMDSCLPT